VGGGGGAAILGAVSLDCGLLPVGGGLPVVVAYINDELLVVMALIKRKINSEVAANEIVLPCIIIYGFTE
jgi:hypothetical protein